MTVQCIGTHYTVTSHSLHEPRVGSHQTVALNCWKLGVWRREFGSHLKAHTIVYIAQAWIKTLISGLGSLSLVLESAVKSRDLKLGTSGHSALTQAAATD